MLEARDIRFAYRRNGPIVLDGVNVSCEAGVRTAVVGPNGSGKSTLLRVLAGLRRPSAGSVTLGGVAVGQMGARERARRVALVPQSPEAAFGFSVARVVAFGRFAAGGSGDANHPAVRAALERVGLAERMDDPFDELSVGQRQRAVLARAIAQLDDTAEAVLLADEPIASMDPAHAGDAMDLLTERAVAGVAVVAVLHDLGLAARWADRAVVLGAGGRVSAEGDAGEVLAPDRLEAVFGVGFHRAQTPAGPVLVTLPRGTSDGGSASRVECP